MGIAWSNFEEAEEKSVKKALETLDQLVWDTEDEITEEEVSRLLQSDTIFTIDWATTKAKIKAAVRERAAEQNSKSMFFLKKNVTDLYDFHSGKRDRYYNVCAKI